MVAFSRLNSRARVLLFAAIGVMTIRRNKQLYKRKQVRRFWRRGIFSERELHSEYFHLYQTLRDDDREFHFNYIRMSKERFDHLLSLIREKITKKDTPMRKPISAEERLIITLRYLSAGMSQQTLSYNFRVGRTTISNILREVCQAIYEVLAPIYMKAPIRKEEWRSIVQDFQEIWDMPHTLGAIDGKHIRMDCPKTTGTTSLCYHGNILTSLEKYKHLVLRPKTFRFQKNFNRLRYPR